MYFELFIHKTMLISSVSKEPGVNEIKEKVDDQSY